MGRLRSGWGVGVPLDVRIHNQKKNGSVVNL